MSPKAVGIVAGSGIQLESILDRVDEEIPFDAVLGLPNTTVHGHPGRFIRGAHGDIPVVLQCGRLHVYEGHDFDTVTRSVDVMKDFDVSTLVLTNAAGGLRENMVPVTLLAIERVIFWPFRGQEGSPESIEPTIVIDSVPARGTYVWIHGPAYETRSEIAALQSMRGDAVGMSTGPELLRCAELGIRTAAIACITNNCCAPHPLTHAQVLKNAARASSTLRDSIVAALHQLL